MRASFFRFRDRCPRKYAWGNGELGFQFNFLKLQAMIKLLESCSRFSPSSIFDQQFVALCWFGIECVVRASFTREPASVHQAQGRTGLQKCQDYEEWT